MKELTLKQAAEDCRGTLTPEQAEGMITGVQIDSRRVKPGDLFVAIKGEKSDGHDFIDMAASLGAAAALVERPVKASIPTILVPDTVKAYGDLAAARRERMGMTVIGITGSVGKTTTKEMTASVLAAYFTATVKQRGQPQQQHRSAHDHSGYAGGYGAAGCRSWARTTPGEMAYLSCDRTAGLSRSSRTSAPRTSSISAAARAFCRRSSKFCAASLKNTVGIFNGDEPLLWNVRADGGHKKYYYGIDNPCLRRACQPTFRNLTTACAFVVSGFRPRVSSCSCRFWVAIRSITRWPPLRSALLLKVPPETIQTQISGFHNTGMRQKIYERDGFTIIEDCYNAGPESTEAALEILAGFRSRTNGRCIAVLGDMLELGNRSAAEHYRIGRIAAHEGRRASTPTASTPMRMVSGAITGGMKQKHDRAF